MTLVLWLGLVPTTLAYVLFARGLRAPVRGRDDDPRPGRAARRRLSRDRLLGEPVGPAALAGGGLLVTGLGAVAVRRPAPAPGPAHRRRADPGRRMSPATGADRRSTGSRKDLRARVLAGDLPPGHRLREEALAGEYGLARHTVRAALRALRGAAARRRRAAPGRPGGGARRLPPCASCSSCGQRSRSRRPGSSRSGAASTRGRPRSSRPRPPWTRPAAPTPPDRAAVDAAHAAPAPRAGRRGRQPADHRGARRARAREHGWPSSSPAGRCRSTGWPPSTATLLERLRTDGPEALRRHLFEGAELAGGRAGGAVLTSVRGAGHRPRPTPSRPGRHDAGHDAGHDAPQ